MADKYVLTYFNVRARGEPVRLIFAAGKIEYEDKRITAEEWAELKPKTPFGGLPVLEHRGRMLGQSLAISRYAARKAKLAGDTALDEALADAIVDSALEIRESYLIPILFAKDDSTKAELTKKLQDEVLPKTLKDLDKILGDQDYFVNNKLTWADLVFQHVIEYVDEFKFGDAVEAFPRLRKLCKRVCEYPGVKEYLAKRPETK